MSEAIFWSSLGILATIAVSWFFFKKSPSKKDIEDLKKISKSSNESTSLLVQKKSDEIKEENLLTANVQLENLINSQFNRYLETKELDKDLLIKELEGNKIKTLYIIKQQEEAIEEKRLLTERIKILGFKRVVYGDWILPPKKLKDTSFFRKKDGVKQWVEKNLLQGIRKHNFVNSVVIIDLSNIYDEQIGKQKRAKRIIGGVLKPADLISKDKLLSDIHQRDKISLRELLQIPFLDILINQEHPIIAETVKIHNSKIVEEISKKLKIQKLVITDLISLDKQDLEIILKKYGIGNVKSISQEILENVKVLNNYFNKNQELIRSLKNNRNKEQNRGKRTKCYMQNSNQK